METSLGGSHSGTKLGIGPVCLPLRGLTLPAGAEREPCVKNGVPIFVLRIRLISKYTSNGLVVGRDVLPKAERFFSQDRSGPETVL